MSTKWTENWNLTHNKFAEKLRGEHWIKRRLLGSESVTSALDLRDTFCTLPATKQNKGSQSCITSRDMKEKISEKNTHCLNVQAILLWVNLRNEKIHFFQKFISTKTMTNQQKMRVRAMYYLKSCFWTWLNTRRLLDIRTTLKLSQGNAGARMLSE